MQQKYSGDPVHDMLTLVQVMAWSQTDAFCLSLNVFVDPCGAEAGIGRDN